MITGSASKIPSLTGCITTCGGPYAFHRHVTPLTSTLLSEVARLLVCGTVAIPKEKAITGSLIHVGRSLVTIGRDLVGIGRGLVTVGRGLIAVGRSLVAFRLPLIRGRETLVRRIKRVMPKRSRCGGVCPVLPRL